jgi:hypothetical protein
MWVYLVISRAETGTSPQGTQYPTTALLLAARFVKGAAVAIATTAAATERMENFIGEKRKRLLFGEGRRIGVRELKDNKKEREAMGRGPPFYSLEKDSQL